jgi:hypothetical protein
MNSEKNIPAIFIQHACNIIANTYTGLTGGQIVSKSRAYALEFNIDIPYGTTDELAKAPNKRTALENNLCCFSPKQQFIILKDLIDSPELSRTEDVEKLRNDLFMRYGHLNDFIEEELAKVVTDTQHWLKDFPTSLSAYESAVTKYSNGIFQRNLLDDLRLALELLLKQIFDNNKSLENQHSEIGRFIKGKGGSSALSNMLVKLIDYYSKYQNEHVKHNDSVIEAEIDFLIEMTSVFMKHLVKLTKLP